jgi:hypothetical protein
MRLSEWRAKPPVRDALGPKVMAVVSPVLGVFGVEDDPHAWVQWGDDPATKYSILVPIAGGLVTVAIRANLAGSGPRATAKVVRWSRLQMGELAVETEGPHRMISFQVESFVLRGPDATADAIGRFALVLLAALEGRPWPPFDAPGRRRPSTRVGTAPRTRAQSPAAKASPGTARAAGVANSKMPALSARTPGAGRAGRGSQA